MTEPSDDVINETIAEFMSTLKKEYERFDCLCSMRESCPVCDKDYKYPSYTNSLDALVPVWEKLAELDEIYELNLSVGDGCHGEWRVDYSTAFFGSLKLFDASASRAAARATYKAIKELEEHDPTPACLNCQISPCDCPPNLE